MAHPFPGGSDLCSATASTAPWRPTQLLLVAGLLGIPGYIAGAGLGAWGRPSLRSTVVVAGLLTNMVGLVVLVPLHGALGAAIAGVASSSVSSVVGVIAMARVAGAQPLAFVVPRRTDLVTILREAQLLLRRTRGAARKAQPTGPMQ